MIKKTLYFGNPAYLKCDNEQMVINIPHAKGIDEMLGNTIPIEDIGIVIIDHQQITISHHLITKLLDNNVALIHCNQNHLPSGLMLNLSGHTLQSQRFKSQIETSLPLKKQLWQQTIRTKILNQAAVLQQQNIDIKNMLHWADEVRSGDTENHEARAAAYYWKNIFKSIPDFKRGREEDSPNHLLNYVYAILRATVARSLVGSGLLPTLGIHHRNQYNAYCLADDVMEPFRPYADLIVLDVINTIDDFSGINKDIKIKLLQLPTIDVLIDNKRSPLMVGLQRTTASLVDCFEGNARKILYPEMQLA
jgi:CRISPR-associated protein Cas1